MILEADLNAAELRAFALIANEQRLLDMFARDESPHLDTCAFAFGKRAKGTPEYDISKSINYRWIYTQPDKPPNVEGGQLRTYIVPISGDKLSQLNAYLNRRYAAGVQWKREQIFRLKKTGLVHNVFGRYRDLNWAIHSHADALREHAFNAALNFPIQTTIGDIMNQAYVRAYDMLAARYAPHEARLIIQCHDALVAYVKSESVLDNVKQILRQAIEQPVPELKNAFIPADFKAGETWGSLKAC